MNIKKSVKTYMRLAVNFPRIVWRTYEQKSIRAFIVLFLMGIPLWIAWQLFSLYYTWNANEIWLECLEMWDPRRLWEMPRFVQGWNLGYDLIFLYWLALAIIFFIPYAIRQYKSD